MNTFSKMRFAPVGFLGLKHDGCVVTLGLHRWFVFQVYNVQIQGYSVAIVRNYPDQQSLVPMAPGTSKSWQ